MPSEGQNLQAKNGLPQSCFTCAGDRIQPIYTRVYDDDLKKEVVKHTSDTDIYELIQESNNTSDITLLKKMINGGQVEPPVDDMAKYGLDMANMPNNIHEVYDRAASAQKAFDSLPDYVQKSFGSVDAFAEALLDGTYGSKLESIFIQQAKIDAAKAASAATQEGGAQ